MVMPELIRTFAAELAALAALALVACAELLHRRRVRQVATLAFGPGGRPAWWVRSAPATRALAAAALAWGLATLLVIPPKVHRAGALPEEDLRHIVLVLDVSPSMKLRDAGPDGTQSRSERVYTLMESFFQRVAMDQFRLSLVAVYNGAKPVVVDTRDVDVVRNFLDGLDMYQAFEAGKTTLLAGLEEAAKLAEPWERASTTVVLISDGDTVPPTGMPAMPPSVSGVLVVGVGDPRAGSFIDGRQSRQDVAMLRQIALRLGGDYHDGNQKHLPTEMLVRLTRAPGESATDQLTRREYALAATGLGALLLTALPAALRAFGTAWGRWPVGGEGKDPAGLGSPAT
jgi:Ca-activated chloride channel family protein